LKALRIGGIALAALLVLLASLFAWAVYTESGTRALLALSHRWLPAGLAVEQISGTVAGTLRVRNLHYRDPGVGMDLRVEDATLETRALALLTRRLHVERAQVSGVRLVLFAPTTPAAPKPLRDPWTAPLDMRVDELRLTRGELQPADAAPFVVRSLRLAASWIGSDIEARTLELDGGDGSLTLSARVSPPAPRLKQLKARFRWRAGGHEWSGVLDARGKGDTLELAAGLESPVVMKLAATLAGLRVDGQKSDWRAHVSVPRFDPHPLLDTDAFRTLALELDAEGDLERLAVRGTLSVDQDRVAIEKLALLRSEQWLEILALRLRLNAQPATLTGHARLSLDRSRPSSAEVAWDEVRLPDAWAGANFRCSGKLAMTTAQQGYAVNGLARLARGSKNSTLTLRLDGSKQRLRIQELELTQLPGSLSVTGELELGKPLRWTLEARARAFDPASFFDAWPGSLDFDLATRGDWPEQGPRANFQLDRLQGRLRARTISGSGDVTLGPDLRPSGHVQLTSGSASLDLLATSAAKPRIDATLAITSLAEWRDDLRGAVRARLSSLGRWPDIEVDAHVNANQLVQGRMSVDTATLDLRAQNGRAPRGTATLGTRGLELAGFKFTTLTAKLEGDEHAHDLRLDARGEPLSLAVAVQGALSRNARSGASWSGTLSSLALDLERVPPLALAEPVRIAVTRDSFDLANSCLAGGDIAVCLSARRDPRSFAAHYSVRALPLDVLVALAAPEAEVTVAGKFEGVGDLRRADDGALSGKATLNSPAGSVSQRGDEKALVMEYRDFGVDLDFTRDAARARLRGTLPRQGELEGAITVAMTGSDPSLGGRAALKLRDLAPLALWLPQVANLKGSGEVSAELAGTVRQPRVGLTVRATGLDAEVPMLGVHLREGSFNATLSPEGRFEADGAIRSGDGTVRITGSRAADEGLVLKLSGSNFLAASIPGARVTMAPDLSLAGRQGSLALTGSVTIGDADVNLEKLSFARSYQASSDVVVVDREVEVGETALGLTADVRVILGDGVKLQGFGLESTVAGELRVLEEQGQPSRATGEIRVAGTYEAFGRKLSISRGRLQFAGTSLDDPQLDILAERKLEDVTAKLRVTGTAQHPTLDVFTDPATSQTDAMAYLITGKAASEAHGEEGQVVSSAAQSVGSVLGNRLAKKLGGKMGFIDEIGVEQNTDLGGNAFTVGKYLSPRFFISYGVGLFEPGSTMTVRYEFTKHWSLEANQAPEDGHAGIRYRIEK
jgi:translocation and assembly module TamB